MILLLILVFIRYYIDRGRLLFCPCSGCQAASLTELGVGYAWENSPLRLVRHCGYCSHNRCDHSQKYLDNTAFLIVITLS